MPPAEHATGLVLSGGGARAAYQVGALRAIAKLLPRGNVQPFPVICGTSAGAINAALLGANGDSFRRGVARLVAGGARSSSPTSIAAISQPFRVMRCA
jgi:NTE family protein